MPSDVTQILQAIESGEQQASDELLPVVYAELRKLAARKMAQEKPDHTLQPTALVHEAFIRLVGDGIDHQRWEGREHFFAAAAESMRRILIDNARKRNAQKRGGGQLIGSLQPDDAPALPTDDETLLSLDDALKKLHESDAALAKLVELRYFTGLTIEQTADILGVSPRTVKRNWAYARAWLRREIDDN